MTRLAKILKERKMTYPDLQILIIDKTGYFLGTDRISKIVTGKQKDMLFSTACFIADALGISIDDLREK